jgi:hypothetical protein
MAVLMDANTDLKEVPESILEMDLDLGLFNDRSKIGKGVLNPTLAKERIARAAVLYYSKISKIGCY